MSRRGAQDAPTLSVRDQLELFVERANELNHTRVLERGFNPGFTLNWDKMQGLRFDFRQPDDRDLKEFLLTFRHFVSSDEPVFVYKVHNILQQVVTDQELRHYLREAREDWSRTLKEGNIKLKLNEQSLIPEHIADLWINGIYFHNDLIKRRKLEDLVMAHFLTRHAFLFFLVDATRIILYMGNTIVFCMREGLIDYNAIRR